MIWAMMANQTSAFHLITQMSWLQLSFLNLIFLIEVLFCIIS